MAFSAERVRQLQARALAKLAHNNGTPPAKPRTVVQSTTPECSLPRGALEAWTLLLLRDQPAHGYELTKRFDQHGLHPSGPRLYRLLRDLEQTGLVRSSWTAGSGLGPERRVYKLTSKGARHLQARGQNLQTLADTLQRFFAHYADALRARGADGPHRAPPSRSAKADREDKHHP